MNQLTIEQYQLAVESSINDLQSLESLAMLTEGPLDAAGEAMAKIAIESIAGIYNVSTESFMGSMWDAIVKVWNAVIATLKKMLSEIVKWFKNTNDTSDKEHVDVKNPNADSRDVPAMTLEEAKEYATFNINQCRTLSKDSTVDSMMTLNKDIVMLADFTSVYSKSIVSYSDELVTMLDAVALSANLDSEAVFTIDRDALSDSSGITNAVDMLKGLSVDRAGVVANLSSTDNQSIDVIANDDQIEVYGSSSIMSGTLLTAIVTDKYVLSTDLNKVAMSDTEELTTLSTSEYNEVVGSRGIAMHEYKKLMDKQTTSIMKSVDKLNKVGKKTIADIERSLARNDTTTEADRSKMSDSLKIFNSELKIINYYIGNMTKTSMNTAKTMGAVARYLRDNRKIYLAHGWSVDKEGKIY